MPVIDQRLSVQPVIAHGVHLLPSVPKDVKRRAMGKGLGFVRDALLSPLELEDQPQRDGGAVAVGHKRAGDQIAPIRKRDLAQQRHIVG